MSNNAVFLKHESYRSTNSYTIGMKRCTIYVVRHGQSEFNLSKITSGHVNPPLTEKGKMQAQSTKEKLSNIHFDEVFSSDLVRAIDTASIIYGRPVPKNQQSHNLRERNFGEYDGKPEAHLRQIREANNPHFESLTTEEQWRYAHSPGMESDHDVSSRFIAALAEIASNNVGKTILVGAHGGTLRTTLISLGYATPKELPGGSIHNGGYAELIYEAGEFQIGAVVGANKITA